MNEQNDRPVHLLLVDDESSVVNALRRSLRREGFTIFTTTNPEEGMRMIAAESIDMVVSDHLMPEMTGLEFFTLISRLHPHVVRIVLTGQADVDMAIRAINQGQVHRFMTKPWDDDELKHILREAAREIQIKRKVRAVQAAAALPVAAASTPARPDSSIRRDGGGVIVLDEMLG